MEDSSLSVDDTEDAEDAPEAGRSSALKVPREYQPNTLCWNTQPRWNIPVTREKALLIKQASAAAKSIEGAKREQAEAVAAAAAAMEETGTPTSCASSSTLTSDIIGRRSHNETSPGAAKTLSMRPASAPGMRSANTAGTRPASAAKKAAQKAGTAVVAELAAEAMLPPTTSSAAGYVRTRPTSSPPGRGSTRISRSSHSSLSSSRGALQPGTRKLTISLDLKQKLPAGDFWTPGLELDKALLRATLLGEGKLRPQSAGASTATRRRTGAVASMAQQRASLAF